MARTKSPYPKKSEIDNVVKALVQAGGEVGGIEVTRDGTIRVLRKLENGAQTAYDQWRQHQLAGK